MWDSLHRGAGGNGTTPPLPLPYILCSALVRDVDLPTGGVNIVRAKLPPPPLAGNVTLALNSVAEFTKTKDNKSSCQAV